MTKIKAVFFDQDGVIIDTERDGHRVSFNMTFKEFGFTDEWDVEYYHELLQIAGGKERMKHHWKTKGFSRPLTEEEIDSLVKEMHKRKTAIFVELIESGKLPLRPGIHRFMKELMEAGIKIGVCTTSNEAAAKAITEKILSDIKFDIVLAGDVVKNKKPDPEIYNLALSKLGLQPEEVFRGRGFQERRQGRQGRRHEDDRHHEPLHRKRGCGGRRCDRLLPGRAGWGKGHDAQRRPAGVRWRGPCETADRVF